MSTWNIEKKNIFSKKKKKKDIEERILCIGEVRTYQMFCYSGSEGDLIEEGPQSRKNRTLSEIFFSYFHGHFSCFRIFFRKALQSNKVPSVIIRSFFTATLVDSPKLCCYQEEKKKLIWREINQENIRINQLVQSYFV